METVSSKKGNIFAYQSSKYLYCLWHRFVTISCWSRLKNSLFRAATLTKNPDFDKCKYFCYGIGFVISEGFSLSDGNGPILKELH